MKHYNCTKKSKTINSFLNNFNDFLNINNTLNNTKYKKYYTLQKKIYNFLDHNHNYNNIKIIKNNFIIDKLNIEDNEYMHYSIKNKLNHTRNITVVQYKLFYNNKKIIINYYFIKTNITEKDLKNHINFISQFVQLIYFITKYEHKNNVFHIYLTDYKKNIISNHINAQNINSGVCYFNDVNKKIIIYRSEEYIKVFIHEFLHSCYIDLYLHKNNDKINNYIYNKFKFIKNNTEIMISESYTEFWCNIIYISIFSYNFMNNSKQYVSFDNYINIFDKFFEKQIYFSALQSVKILDIFDLNYLDTVNNKKINKYKETTHALSYYYFKTLMIFDYKRVISMCNNNIISNETTLINIVTYLTNIYNNKKLINLFNLFRNVLNILKNNNYSFLSKNLYINLINEI